MAHLSPYLSFSGKCREALTFYHRCLGGELSLQRFADSPIAEQMPAEAHDNIVHGALTTNHFTLLASDFGGLREPLAHGNTVTLCLNCDSEEEITALFAKLGEGGTVVDPLADMFWGGKFGCINDRFGMQWLFNYEHKAAQ